MVVRRGGLADDGSRRAINLTAASPLPCLSPSCVCRHASFLVHILSSSSLHAIEPFVRNSADVDCFFPSFVQPTPYPCSSNMSSNTTLLCTSKDFTVLCITNTATFIARNFAFLARESKSHLIRFNELHPIQCFLYFRNREDCSHAYTKCKLSFL